MGIDNYEELHYMEIIRLFKHTVQYIDQNGAIWKCERG